MTKIEQTFLDDKLFSENVVNQKVLHLEFEG